jgi:malonate-semialdehyde dehydrogenase (acetylating)/methylmalonate-semialdehyde dehydrogenase
LTKSAITAGPTQIRNFIGNDWVAPETTSTVRAIDPATAEVIADVPLSEGRDLDRAVKTASSAYREWRRVPAGDRFQYLFRLKQLLEAHFEDLARIITVECGKTLAESRGELRRAIENVEAACGIPMLMQGYNSEDIASGIDEIMIRQPLGVTAIIAPFNFPAMIPFWFFPYAIACGNTCIIKPSERVPLTMTRICELLRQTGLPAGVVNLVNGSKDVVDAILRHPDILSVSFVGSSAVAREVYARAAAAGKRVQCQGGAKNPVVILPDCDLDLSTRIIADSAFGCAGQRCLAASLAVTVGSAHGRFLDAIADAASGRIVGSGLDANVEMGPVITAQSRARIEQLIDGSVRDGSKLLVDGRNPRISNYERGNFVRPTVLTDVPTGSEILRSEVFGPVLAVLKVSNLDEAIALVNSGEYGNMALWVIKTAPARRIKRLPHRVTVPGVSLQLTSIDGYAPFGAGRLSTRLFRVSSQSRSGSGRTSTATRRVQAKAGPSETAPARSTVLDCAPPLMARLDRGPDHC